MLASGLDMQVNRATHAQIGADQQDVVLGVVPAALAERSAAKVDALGLVAAIHGIYQTISLESKSHGARSSKSLCSRRFVVANSCLNTFDRMTTIDYYEQHADSFVADTIGVDMAPLYRPFLLLLQERAAILDAGCGSGRDACAFSFLGYRVTAFDASPALVALAEQQCGLSVMCLRFQNVTWQCEFHGIWASASLLHVPRIELPDVMVRLRNALKPRGILYASFKYGSAEREHQGRRFTDMDEQSLAALLEQLSGLETVETWTTGDQRPGREAERWLNTLLRRME